MISSFFQPKKTRDVILVIIWQCRFVFFIQESLISFTIFCTFMFSSKNNSQRKRGLHSKQPLISASQENNLINCHKISRKIFANINVFQICTPSRAFSDYFKTSYFSWWIFKQIFIISKIGVSNVGLVHMDLPIVSSFVNSLTPKLLSYRN